MVNKIHIVGNVGKDPEIRHLDNGTAIAQFSVATSETYKDKQGNKQTKTTWHNVILWKGLAEIAEKWVKKGQLVYIDGKLSNRSYDAKDGSKKYITEIVGSELKMLGGKSDSSSAPEQGNEPEENSGLPF